MPRLNAPPQLFLHDLKFGQLAADPICLRSHSATTLAGVRVLLPGSPVPYVGSAIQPVAEDRLNCGPEPASGASHLSVTPGGAWRRNTATVEFVRNGARTRAVSVAAVDLDHDRLRLGI